MFQKKLIGIDMRALYSTQHTGVNTFLLHILYEIYLYKPAHWEVIGIDLPSHRIQQLQTEYPFFKEVFDSYITLHEYYRSSFSHRTLQTLTLLRPLRNQKVVEFDIIFCPQPRALMVHPNTALITEFHDIFFASHPDPFSYTNIKKRIFDSFFQYQRIIDNSRVVFCHSHATSRDIESHLKHTENKLKMVYSARPHWKFDTTKITIHVDDLPKNFYLALSGWEWRKNWVNLLLAHKKNQIDNNSQLWLVFTGYPLQQKYRHQLERLIQTQNIQKVKFIECVTNSDKEILLQKCAFLAYPSWYEGFGYPILEAFQYDKPVLHSTFGSAYELAGKAGIAVNPMDVADIARGTQILTQDQNFYQQLQNECSNQLSQFSWKEWWTAFEQVVEASSKLTK
jgi:glycosyltransferase involved in cell wall biosynthesis